MPCDIDFLQVKGFGFGNIFDKEIKLKKSVSDVESDKPKAQVRICLHILVVICCNGFPKILQFL